MRLLPFLFLACVATAQTREGFLNVPGGPVWYRISGEGKGTPILALHGGPGGTSCSFLALDAFTRDRRVIVYDQLGSGRSGRPTDPSLWQVDRFIEELHTLRKKLGLRRVHLLGHSWGASLAAAYVLSKGANGLASLTLASPLLSTPDWIRDAAALKQQLPAAVQATLRKHESDGTTNDPAYREAEAEYTRRFVRRSAPAPPNPACAESIRNSAIYERMWGPTEFHATGSLQSFDLTPRLAELRLPVLLITGEFDEARPETAARYQKLIPGARFEVIPGAAHALFADNPARTLQVLADFFRSLDPKATGKP